MRQLRPGCSSPRRRSANTPTASSPGSACRSPRTTTVGSWPSSPISTDDPAQVLDRVAALDLRSGPPPAAGQARAAAALEADRQVPALRLAEPLQGEGADAAADDVPLDQQPEEGDHNNELCGGHHDSEDHDGEQDEQVVAQHSV